MPGSIPTFPGRVIPVTLKLVLLWLFCRAPGTAGSAIELVCPVLANCLDEIESVICNFYLSEQHVLFS